MDINLKYFASVREALGRSSETVAVPPEVSTVGALRAFLVARGAPWSEALAEGRSLRMACNQVMCGAETPLSANCEVAFFPPVTGG
ncbi:molybdopterin converting factor subunit 1 [Massilia endophytica]|uniref:molybdopterin converting factor subunit 1 n=1 Tax=Massilia endophytica TaxID=2899220 RepID=UPI001E44228F|nr:molybdopterin converting factor subunit 1 [Massilia endophytica]UGQ48505.1 molybdopterin converting factor subunit 1 [Massilia endophytica]